MAERVVGSTVTLGGSTRHWLGAASMAANPPFSERGSTNHAADYVDLSSLTSDQGFSLHTSSW